MSTTYIAKAKQNANEKQHTRQQHGFKKRKHKINTLKNKKQQRINYTKHESQRKHLYFTKITVRYDSSKRSETNKV